MSDLSGDATRFSCHDKERSMSTVTFQLPDSLKQGIEELSAREGFSVEQFMASDNTEPRRYEDDGLSAPGSCGGTAGGLRKISRFGARCAADPGRRIVDRAEQDHRLEKAFSFARQARLCLSQGEGRRVRRRMFDGICFPANGAIPLGLPSAVFRVCSHRLGSGTAAPGAAPARKPTAPSGTANARTTWPAINASPANSAAKAGKSSASGNTPSKNPQSPA